MLENGLFCVFRNRLSEVLVSHKTYRAPGLGVHFVAFSFSLWIQMGSVLTSGLNLDWEVGDNAMAMYTLSHMVASVALLR